MYPFWGEAELPTARQEIASGIEGARITDAGETSLRVRRKHDRTSSFFRLVSLLTVAARRVELATIVGANLR